MPRMRPVLFDLDGTLLTAHGAGRTAVEAALSDALGQPVSSEGVSFSGKTDLQILREVLGRNDLRGLDLDDLVRATGEAYRQLMLDAMRPGAATALAGAEETVDAVAAAGHRMGVLTGNIEPCAYAKLEAAGLGGRFRWGAFGSDDEDRNALPLHAARRYAAHYGERIDAAAFVLVGDTPRDIECARGVGAAVVAVATGRFSRDDLAAYNPDLVLDSLEDAGTLLAFLRG